MRSRHQKPDLSLVGVGLYTPAEAERLLAIPASKLTRWLRGHCADGRDYDRLWQPQLAGGSTGTTLGFRDLVQARVAAQLISRGFSPQKVRTAIALAGRLLDTTHPFATSRFRTDGKTLLIDTLVPGEDSHLIDLFQGGQYVMRNVIEPSLRHVDFEDELASRWWPLGRRAGIVLDPRRQFGRPIDDLTGVPTSILASAVDAEESVEEAARAYDVPVSSIRRAIGFEQSLRD